MSRLLFLLTLGITTWGSSTLSAQEDFIEVEEKSTLSVRTPSLSERKTAKIRLHNGLEAYLISDPQADQSAAALSVHVGSWSDPADAPGLAHFCEHLLFMGTEKYPEEADYHRFVKENGGWSNAYTTSDHTNYMFASNNDAFAEALDRFSWFFKAPLFNPSGVDRELRAIESEYSTHLEQDTTRKIHVFKQLSAPDHPYRRFTIGNRKTLEHIPPERVKKWYENHYSANLMHLVIYSNQPLEEIKKLVAKDFSEIKNKNFSPASTPAPIFDKKHAGKIVHIAPLKDTRTLSLMWELPKKFARRLEKRPGELVAFILGHEGENSLLSQLKKEELAEGLSSGGHDMSDSSYLFDVSIELTDKGIKQIDTIITLVFETIAHIKSHGIPQYIFEEERDMDRIRYAYQEREDAYTLVSGHARALIHEPLETYPEKTLVLQEFDSVLTGELLNHLKAENALFTLSAQPQHTAIAFDQKEPWLGAAYTLQPISEERIAKWNAALPSETIAIPTPNPFVPKNMSLIEASPSTPSSEGIIIHPEFIVNDADWGTLYFANDDRYHVPEVYWILTLKTPYIDLSHPESIVLADLYVRAVQEKLNTYSYPALLAGLEFTIERSHDGIVIRVSGYSENSHAVLDRIFATLNDPVIDSDAFQIYKSSLARRYRNFTKESPLKIGQEVMQSVVYRDFVSQEKKAQIIDRIEYSTFQDYANKVLDKSYLEGVLYGNLRKENAQQVWKSYKEQLAQAPFPKNTHRKQEVVLLPTQKGPFFLEGVAEQTGSAAILTIQNGPYSFSNRAHQQVLGKLLDEPFFSELRTKQQTGYIVFSAAQEIERQLFQLFGVQSATHDPRDLLSRYEQFIENFLDQLENDPEMEKRFDTVRMALAERLKTPPKNMQEMTTTLHLLAFDYDADFDFLEKRIRSFETLSYTDFVKKAKEYIGKENRRRLATLIRGSNGAKGLHYQHVNPPKLRKVSSYQPPLPVE